MAQLAIKGHPTRGKEVIEILEMLGGKQSEPYFGNAISWCYTIIDGEIDYDYPSDEYKVFTLEEFLEKFPYKVGDTVQHSRGIGIITSMHWNDMNSEMQYDVCVNNETWLTSVNFLKHCKEQETMKTITIDDFKANTKEWLIDKLHGMIISKAIKTIGDIHEELHKPQYPKTYEECCKVLGAQQNRHYFYTIRDKQDYPNEVAIMRLLDNLKQLLICREAYLQIAGERMKLGKPWEPDWTISEYKFTIVEIAGIVVKSVDMCNKHILAFPTEEMRDEFYKNFKDQIEQCKELL